MAAEQEFIVRIPRSEGPAFAKECMNNDVECYVYFKAGQNIAYYIKAPCKSEWLLMLKLKYGDRMRNNSPTRPISYVGEY